MKRVSSGGKGPVPPPLKKAVVAAAPNVPPPPPPPGQGPGSASAELAAKIKALSKKSKKDEKRRARRLAEGVSASHVNDSSNSVGGNLVPPPGAGLGTGVAAAAAVAPIFGNTDQRRADAVELERKRLDSLVAQEAEEVARALRASAAVARTLLDTEDATLAAAAAIGAQRAASAAKAAADIVAASAAADDAKGIKVCPSTLRRGASVLVFFAGLGLCWRDTPHTGAGGV